MSNVGEERGSGEEGRGIAEQPHVGQRTSKTHATRRGEADDEVWMYQSPDRKGADLQKAAVPPLSQVFASGPLKTGQQKSGRSADFDSTYIKLAKAGGRKDLLTYNGQRQTSQVRLETQWPEWMDHSGAMEAYLAESRRPVALPEKPEWATYNEQESSVQESSSTSEQPYQFRPPFSLQDKSHLWNREKEEGVKLPQIQVRRTKPKPMTGRLVGVQLTRNTLPQKPATKKLPRIQEDKGPVSMTHLLSNGYQGDWIEKRRQKQMEERAREERQRAERQRIVQRAQNTRRLLAGQDSGEAEKHPFKLSRFANVPSRVKCYMGGGDQS